jgi:hypothetical protein
LKAARALGRRARRALDKRADGWPPHSPGVVNAWLLFVTSKPPTWEDAFVRWEEQPLDVGTPPEGFFYPDPLGFWAEVRRWSVALLAIVEPGWRADESLAVSALLQVGDDASSLKRALDLMRPRLVVFLDETAWQASGLDVERRDAHHIPDPHREGQYYEGFWGVTRDGVAIGKAPHHPAAHRLYRRSDIDEYLAAAPV